jgi:tetratricopeptide (TPR) repeat protein
MTTNSSDRETRSLRLLFILLFAVLLVILVVIGRALLPGKSEPSKPVVETVAASDGFAGSVSCRECHEEFYKLWGSSHHGKAMQPVTPEFVKTAVPELDKWQPVETGQFKVTKQDGKLVFIEQDKDGKIASYEAVHALGGKNIYYFLTQAQRGRLQTLPLAFDLNRKEWFNTQKSAVRHFDQIEDEALPWNHHLYTFNTTCHDCHVSQLSKNYDLKSDTYFTTWKEPGINCESCHGPSQEHIRVCREAAKKGEKPTDLKLIVTSTFNKEQHTATCSACHAKMSPLTGKFIPGDKFYDHFNLVALENHDFYPDGRDLGENYTFTTWSQSPCVQAGADFHCVTCHTSSGRYRFHGEDANRACLPCHQDYVDAPEPHTHHPADSEASQCVSCHMPKTEFGRMIRSDHSMRPPMPSATKAFGSPNACNDCHKDQTVDWADEYVRDWYKRDYQAPTLLVGGLIKEAREGKWGRLDEMIKFIDDNPKKEIFVASLIRLLANCPDEKKWPAIYRAFEENRSPLVRSAAIITIGLDRPEKAKRYLLKALDDPIRLVRIGATSALAGYPRESFEPLQHKKLEKNLQEYKKSLVIRPDDWSSHYRLANFFSKQGQLAEAVKEYDVSLSLFDEAVVSLVNGGYTNAMVGNPEKAEQMFKKAIAVEPKNEAANLNYALLLGEQGRTAEAEKYFRAVMKINPKSAAAAFNLSVLVSSKDLAEAAKLSKVAMDQLPDNPKYAFTHAYYLFQAGNNREAIIVLKKLIKNRPGDFDAWILMGNIYTEHGQKIDAIELYQRAMKVPEFQRRPEILRRFQIEINRLQSVKKDADTQ